MNRFSKKYFSIVIVFLLGILLVTISPLRSKLRAYLGRLWSETTVSLKEDKIVPEDAYEWVLMDRKENRSSFGAFKGEVVLINFWATWCAPCISEMPSLQKLYDLYGDNVRFLFVTDDKRDRVDNFIKKGFDIPVYYPQTAVPDIFYSKTIPTTYIIDKKGRVVMARANAADWYSDDVKSLLQSLVQE